MKKVLWWPLLEKGSVIVWLKGRYEDQKQLALRWQRLHWRLEPLSHTVTLQLTSLLTKRKTKLSAIGRRMSHQLTTILVLALHFSLELFFLSGVTGVLSAAFTTHVILGSFQSHNYWVPLKKKRLSLFSSLFITLFFIVMLTRTCYYMSDEMRRLWQWEKGQGSAGERAISLYSAWHKVSMIKKKLSIVRLSCVLPGMTNYYF